MKIFGVENQVLKEIEDNLSIDVRPKFLNFNTVEKGQHIGLISIPRLLTEENVESFIKINHGPTVTYYLLLLGLAYLSEKLMIVEGGSCSGKTTLVLELVKLLNTPYSLISMNEQT
jgi:hypothetical protein